MFADSPPYQLDAADLFNIYMYVLEYMKNTHQFKQYKCISNIKSGGKQRLNP